MCPCTTRRWAFSTSWSFLPPKKRGWERRRLKTSTFHWFFGYGMTISSRCSTWQYSNTNKWEETWQGVLTLAHQGNLVLGIICKLYQVVSKCDMIWPKVLICILYTRMWGGCSQQALTILQSNLSVLYIAFNFNLSTVGISSETNMFWIHLLICPCFVGNRMNSVL